MTNQNFNAVVLIGMPASGKSSCAKFLSKKLNCSYLDSDELIENAARSTIKDIFRTKGEAYFRRLERSFVNCLEKFNDNNSAVLGPAKETDDSISLLTTKTKESLMQMSKSKNSTLVISTGGGLPVNANNLETLKNLGLVVYLYAEPEILVDRLLDDDSRPLLAPSNTKSLESPSLEPIKEKVNRLNRITSLLSERDSVYKMAHYTIDTSFQSQDEVVNSIIHIFNKWKSNEDF